MSQTSKILFIQRETGNDPKAAALTTLGLSMGAKEILIIDTLHFIMLTIQNIRALTREDVDKAYVNSLHHSVTAPMKQRGSVCV